MNPLEPVVRPFFWRPTGCAPSLESLNASLGVPGKRDVTAQVGARTDNGHPLLVVELAGGKVIGDLRLVATANDVVIGGLQSLFGCAEPERHYLLHRWRLRMPKFRRGTALLLGAGNSDNYYHWMLDSLPRWRMLQTAGWQDYDHVLLHGQPSRFQDETLDRLKVPQEKRLRCSKNFVHQFERLVVPEMPFPLEAVAPWASAWVRALFSESNQGAEKIYLFRGPGRRRLANEPELEAALKSRGFVSIRPAHMTVAGQAGQLSAARCVVAPHGAALSNMVFAPPGALLLELFHPQHKNRCYVNLAAACGHRYLSFDGKAMGIANDGRLEYQVDVAAVLEKLEQANVVASQSQNEGRYSS